MNVVAILPTPAAGTGGSLLAPAAHPNDSLYVLVSSAQEQAVCGVEIYYLQVDGVKGLQWRSRFIRELAGGWSHTVSGSGNPTVNLAELLWNIQSLDADIIDLRWLPRNEGCKTTPRQAMVRYRLRYLPALERETLARLTRIKDQHRPAGVQRRGLPGAIHKAPRTNPSQFRIGVVDDCSKDSSPAIIAKYAALDPHCHHSKSGKSTVAAQFEYRICRDDGLIADMDEPRYYDSTGLKRSRYLCTWQDVDLVTGYRQYDETRQMQIEVASLATLAAPKRNVVGVFPFSQKCV